jgi:hypothetical protein
MIGALAEFEKNLIRERVVAGLESARRRGKVLGRPRVAVDVQRALRLREEGKSWRKVARALGVNQSTLRRAVNAATTLCVATGDPAQPGTTSESPGSGKPAIIQLLQILTIWYALCMIPMVGTCARAQREEVGK